MEIVIIIGGIIAIVFTIVAFLTRHDKPEK
jgi:hypothetical protein